MYVREASLIFYGSLVTFFNYCLCFIKFSSVFVEKMCVLLFVFISCRYIFYFTDQMYKISYFFTIVYAKINIEILNLNLINKNIRLFFCRSLLSIRLFQKYCVRIIICFDINKKIYYRSNMAKNEERNVFQVPSEYPATCVVQSEAVKK